MIHDDFLIIFSYFIMCFIIFLVGVKSFSKAHFIELFLIIFMIYNQVPYERWRGEGGVFSPWKGGGGETPIWPRTRKEGASVTGPGAIPCLKLQKQTPQIFTVCIALI